MPDYAAAVFVGFGVVSAIWYIVSACLGVFSLPGSVLNTEIQMVNTIMLDLLPGNSTLFSLAKWINPCSLHDISSLTFCLRSLAHYFYSLVVQFPSPLPTESCISLLI